MNIVVADDHAIFRDTLSFLIDNKTEHRVVAEIDNIGHITPTLQEQHVDLVLMDYHMPGGDALATAEYIKTRYLDIKIVFLTGTQSGFILKHLSQSDVDGVLHKTDNADLILNTIAKVLDHERHISDSIQAKIEQDDIHLTNREFQIFSLLMQGLSSAQVGDLINIAPRTVDKHKENIMKKAKVSNVVQLVELGHRLQILDVKQ